MLIVTIFLGGWSLPFFHRDGITVAFGDNQVLVQHLPHIWVVIISVLAFFGKTLAICWIQAFVRWSLPRFRYDQLMKLGWTVLLPLSLANIFATGVIWLAIQRGGASVAAGLKTTADLTQGLVAATLTGLIVWAIVGILKKPTPKPTVVGSSASYAAAAGGAKEAPIRDEPAIRAGV
jgi:NADH-quinone oxidoreductase subunit H